MKKLLTKLTFLSVLAFVFVSSTFAQRTISGTMTDADTGEPLIGANVSVVGFERGTISDIDGNYSIELPAGATALEFSYTGYSTQTIQVGDDNIINVALAAGELLDEIVVTGYGSQSAKEVTSSVVRVTEEEFNKGPIANPAQLLQGKVAGLQVYNRGGDPNSGGTIRMRGISTVGANVEPLVVVDGIIGASLQNIDPADIESIDVLKDGSAAAIYGSRGSSGVIIVTTKGGSASEEGPSISYSGQYGISSAVRGISIMNATEFKDAGGTDLGSETDWIDEVTQQGTNQVHNVSIGGGSGNTTYRIAGNIRKTDGILRTSGFDSYNTRINLGTKAFDDKLSVDFNASYTDRDQNFSFNEALRYAILYNPTAPVLGEDSPFPFNGPQYGGFFETLGLFDSFNPVSILEQNQNTGKRQEFNYGLNLRYDFTEAISLRGRVAQQSNTYSSRQYYPTTSLFRGSAASPIRKGRADLYNSNSDFTLYELYGTYVADIGNGALKLTGGYSYQQNNFEDSYLSLGDFPDNSLNFSNAIETSQDLQNAGFINANSNASPDEKIIAFFGRANLTFDDAIFFNASVRREGSTKLGADNQWGFFPAFGAGIDLNQYVGMGGFDLFKVRVGYGVTGALPRDNGLSVPIRNVVNGSDGSVSTELVRAANPDLKWEEKAELNLGIEFATGKLSGSMDLYNRDISDFILNRTVDVAVFGVGNRWENAGKLNTKGLELALNYDLTSSENFDWTTGLVFSTYRTVLEEYVIDAETRGNLGAPGQNGTNMILVKQGEEIGQIWGPRFEGVDEGSPVFADINGDGVLVTGQDKGLEPDVDFEVLGSGIPDFEIGWTNQLRVGEWNINAFFRGAFGHSLVNTFRAFYEPQVSTQSSYNFMNTDLKVDGLTDARFSSLYVEKADFFMLDNITISRSIPLGDITAIQNLNVSLTAQAPFIITSYTGASPEPSLADIGTADNGGTPSNLFNPDVLAPGIDRRNNYFSSRTITMGINFNF
jgi:iron complex outermembrane receptor protein